MTRLVPFPREKRERYIRRNPETLPFAKHPSCSATSLSRSPESLLIPSSSEGPGRDYFLIRFCQNPSIQCWSLSCSRHFFSHTAWRCQRTRGVPLQIVWERYFMLSFLGRCVGFLCLRTLVGR